MNKVKLNDLIKSGNIVIPTYLFKIYKNFNLSMEEFVFLMYLFNKGNVIFDPVTIGDDLNMDIQEVMGYISLLGDKGLVSLDVSEDNGILEERINVDSFSEKISLALIDELNTKEPSSDTIYDIISQEFNRELSPMEKEKISEWQNEYSDELIKEAVKDTVINGVSSLRYVDKILYDWERQGIKSVGDIKVAKEATKEEVPVYKYNWLDDDDDEI